MRDLARILIVFVAVGITVPLDAQENGGLDVTGPYEVVQNWWKPPHGRYQHVSGVFAVSPDRVFVTTTTELPTPVTDSPDTARAANRPPNPHHHFILVFDANGNVVEEWTQWSHLFQTPHKVRISPYDPDKHVWIVDKGTHQVFKFTQDGNKLVMTLGEKGVRQTDETHFSVPADIGFLPDGSFFVVEEGDDGKPARISAGNSRVIRFDKNGKFVLAWETKSNTTKTNFRGGDVRSGAWHRDRQPAAALHRRREHRSRGNL